MKPIADRVRAKVAAATAGLRDFTEDDAPMLRKILDANPNLVGPFGGGIDRNGWLVLTGYQRGTNRAVTIRSKVSEVDAVAYWRQTRVPDTRYIRTA